MIAVDTNVVVRLLTADDPGQYRQSVEVFANNDVFIPDTVIMETEWVLRFAYKFERPQIVEALRRLFGYAHVALSDPASAALALDWYESGLDFADALHLALSQNCDRMVSFDRRFIQRSARLASVPVSLP